MPQYRDIRRYLKNGSCRYSGFAKALKKKYSDRDAGIIDFMDRKFDLKRFHVSKRGHASEYGNEVIAGILYSYITKHGLLGK